MRVVLSTYLLFFYSLQTHVMYKREVNPNRVNLFTDVEYDGSQGASKVKHVVDASIIV